jgi:predicted RNA-binding Zn-ribbon protein involved in translation (DUF1610 family)
MKTKFFYSMILVVGLIFAGSSFNNVYGQTTKKTETKAKTSSVKYTCPMHPEVVMNKPGKCPKCGMALVVKKEAKKESIKEGKKEAMKEKMGEKKEATKKMSKEKMKGM